MRPRDRMLLTLAGALYRTILGLYPASFRERCGAPMLLTFDDVCRSAVKRGLASFFRECSAECADALAGAWRARFPKARPHARSMAGTQGTSAGDSFPRVISLDVFRAMKRLRGAPGLLLLTTLTLGFAIAATTAIFSIVDAVLLRPSPFADASRLMGLMNVSAQGGHLYPGMSRDKLRHWRTESGIFEAVEAYRQTSVIITGAAEAEEVAAAHTSPGLIATLRVPARHGRIFLQHEAQPGSDDVVLVSEDYWRSRLGADPMIVGRALTVNGRPHTIVGVMPARFHFPTLREALWLPLDVGSRPAPGEGASSIVVRLASGLSAESARERLAAASDRLEREQPIPTGWKVSLVPNTVFGPDERTRRTVWILFGAVALVLLTACANVANLLLSRAIERRRELAIRLVLGAGRWRLARELAIEGMLIGLAAAAVGLVAAKWALDLLARLAPEALTYSTTSSIALDQRAFAFGLALAVLTGVVCNLLPAIREWGGTSTDALTSRTRAAAATPFHRRVRSALVVAEIALAVVLLVGAALMVRSFGRLNAVDVGFDPENLLGVTVGLDRQRYPDERSRVAFLRQVARDIEQLPGSGGVAIASGLPPTPGTLGLAAFSTDRGPCGEERTPVVMNLVSDRYFGLMGIRLIEGRPLRSDDAADSVVVSAAVARQCGGSLVGRRLRLDASAPALQVVGVAADVRTRGITEERGELAIYLPFDADPAALPMVAGMHERRTVSRRFIIRTDRPAAVATEVRRILRSADPDQPVLDARPASELMAESVRRERFVLATMTLFSAVSLALASAGIFAVLAYIVAHRTNEIGIRVALGASANRVVRLIVGQGVGLALWGTVAGLLGAFAFSRVLAGLLFEIDPHDPVAFIVTPLLVLVVAVLAAWVPTRRALRVDPASALRVE